MSSNDVRVSYRRYNDILSLLEDEPHIESILLTTQTEPGDLSASCFRLEYSDLMVQQYYADKRLQMSLRYSTGWTRFLLYTGKQPDSTWQGVHFKPNSLVVVPDVEGVYSIGSGHQDTSIHVSQSLLEEMGVSTERWTRSSDIKECFLEVPPAMASEINKALDDLKSRYTFDDGKPFTSLLNPDLAGQLRSRLFEIIAYGLTNADSGAQTKKPSRRFQLVQRALNHVAVMEDDQVTELTVDDWSEAIGASRKTLLRAFSDVLYIAPYRFLLHLRLNVAHRDLQSGAKSVLEVSTRCGFSKPGDFATFYKEFYGVLPSDTLAQSKK
ncbi:helix-turn-helix transcriptional regulator [Paraferrimonas sedimenticola]|uniref:HTH araC/xylS-type domain-containing protein n=1 Tax=Paraferrimonas sedimenticola TaxID=375674 RepID=A0AA37W0U7_9GAMM|nr:helix-turn-helix transcriptional regulator [Paraferrimonas sedimenticola]GLP96058.1 hypothetical protein GCM10007895_13640 [Paraferrimonas sedimenticola]